MGNRLRSSVVGRSSLVVRRWSLASYFRRHFRSSNLSDRLRHDPRLLPVATNVLLLLCQCIVIPQQSTAASEVPEANLVRAEGNARTPCRSGGLSLPQCCWARIRPPVESAGLGRTTRV